MFCNIDVFTSPYDCIKCGMHRKCIRTICKLIVGYSNFAWIALRLFHCNKANQFFAQSLDSKWRVYLKPLLFVYFMYIQNATAMEMYTSFGLNYFERSNGLFNILHFRFFGLVANFNSFKFIIISTICQCIVNIYLFKTFLQRNITKNCPYLYLLSKIVSV